MTATSWTLLSLLAACLLAFALLWIRKERQAQADADQLMRFDNRHASAEVWGEFLREYVSRPYPPMNGNSLAVAPMMRGFFPESELWSDALHMTPQRSQTQRLVNAMTKLGFRHVREPHGARRRGFLRPGWRFVGGRVDRTGSV